MPRTPTPWTLDAHNDRNQQLPIRADGRIIAAIRDEGTLADGRLIIAAPELLDALIEALNAAHSWGAGFFDPAWAARAVAAITKATKEA